VKRLNVIVELNDGTELKARTAMADYLRYEETAKRQKPPWGSVGDSPSHWEAFVSWSALKRTGQYDGGWEQFKLDAVAVDATPEEVDPTTGEAGDGSS